MKFKFISYIAILFCLLIPTTAFAQIEPNTNSPIFISSSANQLFLTYNDVTVIDNEDFNCLNPYATWYTYKRTISFQTIHEMSNPSLSNWPQSVEYEEPYEGSLGGMLANGTLYIQSATKQTGGVWLLVYSGTMGVYLR